MVGARENDNRSVNRQRRGSRPHNPTRRWSAGRPLFGAHVGGVGVSWDGARAAGYGAPFSLFGAGLYLAYLGGLGGPHDDIPGDGYGLTVSGDGPVSVVCALLVVLGVASSIIAATTMRQFGRPLTTR